ncbi:MAG: Na+/H+ antiporter subunit E [Pseudomonadota bacterium]
MRLFGLGACLLIYWLALSGYYTPFLISMGLLSVAVVIWFSIRVEVIDREGQPFELVRAALTYWPWLIVEIAKSAVNVTRILLSPSLPISPTMTRIRAQQRTSAGVATYANSITLTPGTITTDAQGANLTVHALTKAGALDVEGGEMDRRVKQFEGRA